MIDGMTTLMRDEAISSESRRCRRVSERPRTPSGNSRLLIAKPTCRRLDSPRRRTLPCVAATSVARLATCVVLALSLAHPSNAALADSGRDGRAALAAEIESVVNRPEYKIAQFGILFVDIDSGRTVYELNADK